MALLPGVVSHNWRLKLAAVGLSVLLWALVQTDGGPAETFSAVPVVVEVEDTLWTLDGSPEPGTVELRLSGPTREMFRLAREGTLIRVPVEAVGSRDTLIALRRDWVVLGEGSGVSVESVSPGAVRINFEPALARALPVSVRTEGSFPANRALASPMALNPPVMRVRGPESAVEGLDSVRLEPLDLSTVTESGVYEVRVDTTRLGQARVTPGAATLTIRLEEELERVIAGVPIVLRPAEGDSLMVEPGTVDVTLRGARTLVTAVSANQLQAVVPADQVGDMVGGEERRVPVRIEGVPALVVATPSVESITIRRAGGEGGAP